MINSSFSLITLSTRGYHSIEFPCSYGFMRSPFLHSPMRFNPHLPALIVGTHCLRAQRAAVYFLVARSMHKRRIPSCFPCPKPVASASIPPSSTTTPSYDRVCLRVDMRTCRRYTRKIHDLRIGEGGRSSPCLSGVAFDGIDLELVDSGILS